MKNVLSDLTSTNGESRISEVEPEMSSPDNVDRLDHFTIIRKEDGSPWELGRGRSGISYKAFDPKLQTMVALKIIDLRNHTRHSAVQELLTEAHAASRLRHANIATLFSYGHTDGRFFYATEYINGETIDKRVQREGPLHPMLALRITRQVARALVAADQEKLIHRDIKPANLMLALDKGEDQLVVKLVDFGQAKTIIGLSSEQASGDRDCPPPCFVSPEQLEGKEPDIRSDIYSLGATLWFMLSGRPPFQGSVASVTYQQISQLLPDDILARFPSRVAALLEKLLTKQPEDRFQNPTELKLELDQQIGELKDQAPTFAAFDGDQMISGPVADSKSVFTPGQRVRNRYLITNECRYDKTAFEAKDTQSNNTVALRPLPLTSGFDVQRLSELREEISQIHDLRHPNLVQLLALESADCGLFIVSEWVNGFSILELLQSRHHRLAWSENVQLVRALAVALDFVAEKRPLSRLLSLDSIYVDLPPNSEGWTEVQRSPVSCWPPFVPKLEAISLGKILGEQFLTRPSVEPSDQISSEHPVRQLCSIIYQLLSGASAKHHLAQMEPEKLEGLSENGNELLHRGLKEPDQFAAAKDFLAKLEAVESESEKSPLSSASGGAMRRLETRAPKLGRSIKKNSGVQEFRSSGDVRQLRSIPIKVRPLHLLIGTVFCALIVLLGIKLLPLKIPTTLPAPHNAALNSQSPSPTATPFLAMGRVQLNSDPPGLQVELLNGDRQVSRGVTPMTLDSLPVGKYVAKISRPGWPDYQQEIDLQQNGLINVTHAFSEVKVTLTSDPPGASIFKAGQELGKTPLTVSLPPIPVELVSRFGTLLPVAQQLTPKVDGSTVLEFKHSYGVLSVKSNRADAEVFISGVDIGKAPVEQALSPGQQDVLVKVPGLPDQTQRTEIQNGQRMVLWFSFVAAAEAASSPANAVASPESTPLPSPNQNVVSPEHEQQNDGQNEHKTKHQREKQSEVTDKRRQQRKTERSSLIPPGKTYDQAKQDAFSRFDSQWDAKKVGLKVRRDYLDSEVQHSSGPTQQKWQRQLDQVKQQLAEYNSQRHNARDALERIWNSAVRETH
jgi:serine/threonine protein kinase